MQAVPVQCLVCPATGGKVSFSSNATTAIRACLQMEAAVSELITHSRMEAFKTCRKKHWFAYELGIRPSDDARALRMGSAGHAGAEALGRGLGLAAACESVR